MQNIANAISYFHLTGIYFNDDHLLDLVPWKGFHRNICSLLKWIFLTGRMLFMCPAKKMSNNLRHTCATFGFFKQNYYFQKSPHVSVKALKVQNVLHKTILKSNQFQQSTTATSDFCLFFHSKSRLDRVANSRATTAFKNCGSKFFSGWMSFLTPNQQQTRSSVSEWPVRYITLRVDELQIACIFINNKNSNRLLYMALSPG